jgi:hypothetical protein
MGLDTRRRAPAEVFASMTWYRKPDRLFVELATLPSECE